MTLGRYSEWIWIGAGIVVYILLRVNGLAASCLWFDEIFGVHAAERYLPDLLQFVSLDLIHPPLFYVLLKGWIFLFGDALVAVRAFSVVIAIAAVIPLLGLCNELGLASRTKALAVFVLAINGSAIKYAQEVRMYSLSMLLSLTSLWLFTRCVKRGSGWALLTVANIAFVYTHYYGWLLIAAQIVYVMLWARPLIGKMFLTVAALAVAFLPWLWITYTGAASGDGLQQNIGWISRPGPTQILGFLLNLVEPFYFQASSIQPRAIYLVTIPLLLLLSYIAGHQLLKSRTDDPERSGIRMLATAVLVPIVLAFILSWVLPHSIWGTRHLIIVLPPICIILAVFVDKAIETSRFIPAAAALIIVCAFILTIFRPVPTYAWCAFEPMIANTEERVLGTPIYAVEDLVAYHLWFSSRKEQPTQLVIKADHVPDVPEDPAYFLPRGFDGVTRKPFSEISEERLILAYRSRTISPGEPPLRNFLVKGYRIVEERKVEADGEAAALVLLAR